MLLQAVWSCGESIRRTTLFIPAFMAIAFDFNAIKMTVSRFAVRDSNDDKNSERDIRRL
ncbi:hypothetical protein [Burkholderia perseverans]|uniref:hypothetical protein n=1 Tax=Burkholderia perseverans TaxID=2615214 RepID=UPI001FEDA235|nr:hypothetical protein [Burkholderia perseverans]